MLGKGLSTIVAALAVARTFSIPIAEVFDHVIDRPPILLGFANPDCRAHAPNEFMRLGNYETGIRTICFLWEDLSSMTELVGWTR